MVKLPVSVFAIFLGKQMKIIFITSSKTHKKIVSRKFPNNMLFTM